MPRRGRYTVQGDGRTALRCWWARGNATPLFRILALAASSLWLLTFSGTASAEFQGRVLVAEGGPFTLIRGDRVYRGAAGVTVLTGDIIETGTGALVVIEAGGGGLTGLGPATRAYLSTHADVATWLVPKGWIKIDVHAPATAGGMRAVGLRLGVLCDNAVAILAVDDRSDSVFSEQGLASLLIHDAGTAQTSSVTKEGRLYVRRDHERAVELARPLPEFVAMMPIPFRDPLPHALGRAKSSEATFVREVTYSDIQGWLAAPREWRAAFVQRFQSRLKDARFLAHIRAHLRQHPEWAAVIDASTTDEIEGAPPSVHRSTN